MLLLNLFLAVNVTDWLTRAPTVCGAITAGRFARMRGGIRGTTIQSTQVWSCPPLLCICLLTRMVVKVVVMLVVKVVVMVLKVVVMVRMVGVVVRMVVREWLEVWVKEGVGVSVSVVLNLIGKGLVACGAISVG